jgi:hypothetical protein
MNAPDTRAPRPASLFAEIRVGLICAALMLAIPLGAKLAARSGHWDAGEFQQRTLMAIAGIFIVLSGNTIPKRITSVACRGADEAQTLAFYRFAGWTWVLAGLALGLVWVLAPLAAADTATLLILPTAIALIAVRWLGLRSSRRPAA